MNSLAENKNMIAELMSAHRSIRKYKKEAINPHLVEEILNAAFCASTSGNMQCYSVITTTDMDLKQQLLEPHFNQTMVMEAPMLVTFCADFNRMRRWLDIERAPDNFDNIFSFMIAAIDAVLVAQNAALAFESYGYGICFLGTTLASANQIGPILNCSKNVIPVAGFVVGKPDETPSRRERLPSRGIIHREQYRDYSDKEILKIYKEKNRQGMKRYNDNPELHKQINELGIENLAQIYTKLKYSKESHINYSHSLMNYLRDQNFLT